MMRASVYILFVAASLFAASCSRTESLEEIQERVGKTAEAYYNLLLHGKYADFVAGMKRADSLPASYREQLVANAVMYVQQQKDEHEGITSVTYTRCVADTAQKSAEVFMTVKYKDKSQEIICVPMVQRNDIWYMK